MARSKKPHPRIEAAPTTGLGLPDYEPIYADTRRRPLSDCDGCYVLIDAKADELHKVHIWKGRCNTVLLGWIREDGVKRVADERADGSTMANLVLREDGSVLAGTWRFRRIANVGTIQSGGQSTLRRKT